MQPGGCIKADTEAFARVVGAGEIGVGPFCIFANKFDIAVTSLRYVGEALLEE